MCGRQCATGSCSLLMVLGSHARQLASLPTLQAFSSWIHICAVRLFVESILRYGLPPQVRGGVAEQGLACRAWRFAFQASGMAVQPWGLVQASTHWFAALPLIPCSSTACSCGPTPSKSAGCARCG